MDFMKQFLYFLTLTVFSIKYVEPYPQPTDCSTIVTTNTIRFLGCKEQVSTDSLTIRAEPEKTVYTFKGIPYAEPPIGSLRFRKPIAKVFKRNELIDARRYRAPCMQPWISDWPFGRMSEDCLHLNVWTPTVKSTANLPVMFWIYGGAFSVGSGAQLGALFITTDNIFKGTQLVLRDIVVVTINYRLGIFGFLYGNTTDCPGNQGLWDQAVALKWVKNNIRAFGGNPNDITLFGESAGSISISNHIISTVTRNLFQKAIMQSGSSYIKLFSRDTEFAYKTAIDFAKNENVFQSGNCADEHQWIDCLRRKTASELLMAQALAIIHLPLQPWYISYMFHFSPIFGDEFVPVSVNSAVRTGKFRTDIKILMGHNEMEGVFFTFAFDVVVGMFGRYIPILPIAPVISKQIVFNDIQNYFFDNNTIGVYIAQKFTETFSDDIRLLDRNGIRRSAVHSFGDYFLTCPTILFGGHLVKNSVFTGSVYQYRLTYAHKQSIARLSGWTEVTHTDDLALVFGAPFSDPNLFSKSDRKLSREIMDIWTHFAKYGKPPKVNGNYWPKYGLIGRNRVNATYVELHASSDRFGRVWTNGYELNSIDSPDVINDCFYFWDQILTEQFGEFPEQEKRELQKYQKGG